MLSSVAARLYTLFPHYLKNGTIFEKKVVDIKLCFDFPLHLTSETFLILKRTEGDKIKICIGIHAKYPLFF
jgi:hypothetical protein